MVVCTDADAGAWCYHNSGRAQCFERQRQEQRHPLPLVHRPHRLLTALCEQGGNASAGLRSRRAPSILLPMAALLLVGMTMDTGLPLLAYTFELCGTIPVCLPWRSGCAAYSAPTWAGPRVGRMARAAVSSESPAAAKAESDVGFGGEASSSTIDTAGYTRFRALTKIRLRELPDTKSKPTGDFVEEGDVFHATDMVLPPAPGHYGYLKVLDREGWVFDTGISGRWAGKPIVDMLNDTDESPVTVSARPATSGNRDTSRFRDAGYNRPDRPAAPTGPIRRAGGSSTVASMQSGSRKRKKKAKKVTLQLSPDALQRVDRAAGDGRTASDPDDYMKKQEQLLVDARQAAAQVRKLILRVQVASSETDIHELGEELSQKLDLHGTLLGAQASQLRDEADRALLLASQRVRNAAASQVVSK